MENSAEIQVQITYFFCSSRCGTETNKTEGACHSDSGSETAIDHEDDHADQEVCEDVLQDRQSVHPRHHNI